MTRCEICTRNHNGKPKENLAEKRLCRECIYLFEINPLHLFPASERKPKKQYQRDWITYYAQNKERILIRRRLNKMRGGLR